MLSSRPPLSIPSLAKLAGCSRQQMWNLAEAGGIPAEPVNPGRSHRLYGDTAHLRQWCSALLVAHEVKRKQRRRLLPGSFTRIENSLLRINVEFHKLHQRRALHK